MTVGQAMRETRKLAGLTQEQLAAKASINRVTLARLESDRHVGRIDVIENLADALGVSIDRYTGHRIKRKNYRFRKAKKDG